MIKENRKCFTPIWRAGETFQDFVIERVEELTEIRTTIYLARHQRVGAQVVDLHCQDRENVFAVAFMTPPIKSDGLPHILEHCVLAGSVNYPVKDAFNELIRGTLQTFLNAFTYPDRTIYPVASQVKADFYNLARVYSDLVFRPLLKKETFAQEGHHLEFSVPDDPSSPLIISGVVYNEMKGAYSSPENLMFKAIQEHLFPDTIYRFDSGGEPEEIIKLTYEEFVAFHRKYYSPSNARFFFYGDISPEENLAFLSDLIAPLEGKVVHCDIPPQLRWTEPRMVKKPFPILKQEDPAKKGVVNVAWLLADQGHRLDTLLLEIISGILVGTAAGPLRKALIDSRLGEDLSPVTGFETDLRETFFVVGLRGTDTAKAREVEEITLQTLREIVKKGIDRDLVEAVLHQVEFAGKEIVRKTFPYGLKLMGRVFQAWPYGGDIVQAINFPVLIENVRRRWKEEPRLFEMTIEKWLINNHHRLLCVMEPSSSYLEEREERTKEFLAEKRLSMKEEDVMRILEEAKRLKMYQQSPDSPEAVNKIPRLSKSDLERQVEIVPTEVKEQGDITILTHDLFTNGIAYLDLAFDTAHIPEDMIPYLPLLGKLMSGLGAAGLSYEDMAKRIALNTGGISISPACGLRYGKRGEVWERLMVRTCALYRKIDEAINTVCDLLTECDFSDRKRIEDLLMERKNRLTSAIVPSGHLFAKMMAASSLSLPAWREEQWEGRSQLLLVSQSLDSFRDDPDSFVEKMIELKETIIQKGGLVINLTADEEGMKKLSDCLPALLERLKNTPRVRLRVDHLPIPRHMGIVVPAEVSYVAGAIPAPLYGEKSVASMLVVSKYLSNGYLYKTIRVQGGAYGGSCVYDPASGVFVFLSYRDPHIVRTIGVFRETANVVFGTTPAEEEIEKAIVSTIGAMDRPLDPSGKGYVALTRYLSGLGDDYRQALRESILDLSVHELTTEVRDCWARFQDKMVVAILGSEGKLKEANEELDCKMVIEPLFPSK
ncbi:MAG: insulinase family protein [Syntrophales bacterium]|nr:insulinase family protein [Syntrophales bacterium]